LNNGNTIVPKCKASASSDVSFSLKTEQAED